MAKSRWHTFTPEQKAKHIETARLRRARNRGKETPEQILKLKQQRAAATARRKERDLEHHRAVAANYKRSGKGWFHSWANQIKNRAKNRGIPCDIDADYLISIYTDTCPIYGVPFVRKANRRDNAPYTPTVDRIVPHLGYVKGNLIIISRRANNIKSDASWQEMIQVAEFYRNLLGDN